MVNPFLAKLEPPNDSGWLFFNSVISPAFDRSFLTDTKKVSFFYSLLWKCMVLGYFWSKKIKNFVAANFSMMPQKWPPKTCFLLSDRAKNEVAQNFVPFLCRPLWGMWKTKKKFGLMPNLWSQDQNVDFQGKTGWKYKIGHSEHRWRPSENFFCMNLSWVETSHVKHKSINFSIFNGSNPFDWEVHNLF